MLCLLKAAALQGDEKGLTCYSSCAHRARMKPFPLREFVSRRECVSRALEKAELRFLDALLGGYTIILVFMARSVPPTWKAV